MRGFNLKNEERHTVTRSQSKATAPMEIGALAVDAFGFNASRELMPESMRHRKTRIEAARLTPCRYPIDTPTTQTKQI